MAQQPYQRLFYGYSTLETDVKKQEFSDIELIKRDLMNAFYTRPGERVMLPKFGCGVWNLLFEPFDQFTEQAVISEIQTVIDNETRVQANNFVVTVYDQGIQVQMDLYYVPFNVLSTFSLTFDQQIAQAL